LPLLIAGAAIFRAEVVGFTLVTQGDGPAPINIGTAGRIAHQRDRLDGRYLRPGRRALGASSQKLPSQSQQDHCDKKPDQPTQHHRWLSPLVNRAETLERLGRRERFGTARSHTQDLFPGGHGTVEVTIAECANHAKTEKRLGVRRIYLE